MSLASQINALATRIGQEIKAIKAAYLLSSAYTASDVLAKIKTVDGSGSGLDADTLDGLHASGGASANTVVTRDANGYIYGSYINSNRGLENSAAESYIYDNSDGWMRKKSLANVRAEIVIASDVLAKIKTVDGAGSGLDADLLSGKYFGQIVPFHSGSDFPNGTLIRTSIPATASSGASFIIEISGKSYSSNPPFLVIAQGYLYSDTIIAYSGITYGGDFHSYIKMFQDSGALCFWWPRYSYWNSFQVHVRDANGSIDNTVTSIADSVELTGTKKVQVNLVKAWNSSNFDPTEKVDTGDSRLTNARPASDVSAWAKAGSKPSYGASEISQDASNRFITDSERTTWNGKIAAITKAMVEAVLTGAISTHSHSAYEAAFSKNSAFNKNFGSASGEVCQGNDARLSDARAANGGVSYYTMQIANTGNCNTLMSGTPASYRSWCEVNNTTNAPNTGWFFIESIRHSNSSNVWGTQYAHGWEDNQNRLWKRNVSAGIWTGWFEIFSEKNFDPATKVGTGDSRLSDARPANGGMSLNVSSPDGARNPSSWTPNSVAQRVRFDFSTGGNAGVSSRYAGVMSYHVWDGTTAGTGDAAYQLAFGGTASDALGVPMLNIRKGIDATWNSWYTLFHSGNFDPATKVGTGDARLSDARPASDVSAWAKAGSKPGYNASEVGLGNVSNAAQVTTAYNSLLNSDTRNSRGVTRLYRNESDSDYSVQIYWTGTHWLLQGYNGDTFHAGVRVLYADTAGSSPASDVSAWAKAGSKPSYSPGEVGAETAFSKNSAFNKNFGSASGEVCQGNDTRLADQRTPTDLSLTYAKVANNLKTSASVSSTVDLSANGIGKIVLSGNTAFTFTNFELNKSYLLIITANGYTPSFSVGAKHVPVVGNASFDTSSVFYVNMTCIDATSGSEKLLTTVMKGA